MTDVQEWEILKLKESHYRVRYCYILGGFLFFKILTFQIVSSFNKRQTLFKICQHFETLNKQ